MRRASVIGKLERYPAHPVTFISAAPPGGGWYQLCEQTVRALREEGLLPVEVRMEEVQGAVKLLEEMATERKGDVNTLVAFSPGLSLQILNSGSKFSYTDIIPIAATSTDYGVLVASNDSPIANFDALVTILRRNPQSVALGGGQPPGLMHHGMVASLALAAGLDPSQVPYIGSANIKKGLSTLLAGRTAVGAFGVANILDELGNGTIKILAVLSEERLPGPLEEVPTAIEQGFNITFPMWRGFYAPAGIPAEVAAFWREILRKLGESRSWARVLHEMGWFRFFLAGDQFAKFLEEDTRRYTDTLRGGVGVSH